MDNKVKQKMPDVTPVFPLTPDGLEEAYAQGFFPMADTISPDAPIHWLNPDVRTVFLVEAFHVPRRLKRWLRQQDVILRLDPDIAAVMQACADRGTNGSWINSPLIGAYAAWSRTLALTVWQKGERIGGIYGVQMGGIFMAESMFSRRPNASKIALVGLMAMLRDAGVVMVDVQFPNDHIAAFGLYGLERGHYLRYLNQLRTQSVYLSHEVYGETRLGSLMQSFNQTS